MYAPEQDRCFYHPNSIAVEKCENCGKLICLKCKRTRKAVHSYSIGTSGYIFCPACYQTVDKRSRKLRIIAYLLIVVVGVGSIFLIIWLATMASSNMPTLPEFP